MYRLQVRALHPDHTAASVAAFLPRLRYYENGTCIVHHIFGGEVRLTVIRAEGFVPEPLVTSLPLWFRECFLRPAWVRCVATFRFSDPLPPSHPPSLPLPL